MLEASAGSGKTYNLVRRYFQVLSRGADPDRVLATTFSRKAAKEIFDRIIVLLLECSEDEMKAKELGKSIGRSDLTSDHCYQIFLGVTEQFSAMPIGTLDSFAQKLARLFASDLSLPEDWAIPTGVEERYLQEVALRSVLSEHTNAERKELLGLITAPDSSRSVFSRLFGKVSRLGVVARETDDQQWWWELGELGLSKSGDKGELVEKARLLEIPKTKSNTPDKRWLNAHEKSIRSLEADDWKAFLKQGIAASLLDEKDKFGGKEIPTEWGEVYSDLTKLAAYALGVELLRRTHIVRGFLSGYLKKLEESKLEQRLFGFSEVKERLAKSLTALDSRHVAYRLDRRIDHVLVDEFQDTTLPEWEMIQSLSDEIAAAPLQDRSVFIVGDPKQSIYGWRGALPQLFAHVKAIYPHLEIGTLRRSFRSSPVIIECINTFFSHLKKSDRLQKYSSVVGKWMEGFSLHEAAKEELPGFVSFEPVNRGEQGVFYQSIAKRISDLLLNCPNLEVAILVRTNKQILPYVLACEELGLEVSAEGGNAITDSPLVLALLHLCHLLSHPRDTVSLYHVRQTPLESWLFSEEGTPEAGIALLRRRVEEEGLCPVLREAAALFSECSSRRDEARVEILLQMALEFDQGPFRSLDSFIERVRTEQVEEGGVGVVRIMTVHKSKGLEFDAVFLPELTDSWDVMNEREILRGGTGNGDQIGEAGKVILYADRFTRKAIPQLQELYDQGVRKQVREELSVLYVALSRARHALYIFLSDESSSRLSSSALLEECFLGGGGELAVSGAEKWFEEIPRKESVDRESVTVYLPEISAKEWPRKRFFHVKSPSEHDSPTVSLNEIRSEQRGNFFHAVCQEIEWLRIEPIFEAKRWNQFYERFGLDESKGERYANELEARLRVEAFRPCFERDTYSDWDEVSVFLELPFSYFEEGQIVLGIVDRVVVARRDGEMLVRIFDLKTGYGDESEDALKSRFSGQLRAYRGAVQKIFQGATLNVQSYLCLLDRGELLEMC